MNKTDIFSTKHLPSREMIDKKDGVATDSGIQKEYQYKLILRIMYLVLWLNDA